MNVQQDTINLCQTISKSEDSRQVHHVNLHSLSDSSIAHMSRKNLKL